MIELQHFKHVLSVSEFVFEFFKARKIRLQNAPLHIDLMLKAVQTIFLIIKDSFLFKHTITLRPQLV